MSQRARVRYKLVYPWKWQSGQYTKNAESLSEELGKIHRTVKLANQAAEQQSKHKSGVYAENPNIYSVGDKVNIWRPVSTHKKAKQFDWIPATVTKVFDQNCWVW